MPSRFEVAAELRLGKKRTRQTQDLVCLAQLAHFALQGLDALFFGSGRPWTLAGITLLLAYPATQRFRCAADLGCDGFDRSPLRAVLAGGLADHAHGALDDFGGILGLLLHDSILSNNGASTKSGAVQPSVDNDINKVHLFDIPKECIKEIYIGANADSSLFNAVFEAIFRKKLDVKIFVAYVDDERYALNFRPIEDHSPD